jgi:putative transposase
MKNMRKTFQYRIYPTKKQLTLLENTLEQCRLMYNHLLEMRKQSWELEKKGLSLYDQQATFKVLKQRVPELNAVYSQVYNEVTRRIELAYQAFFRRVKRGEKPGYPRFHGRGRYTSFTYPQSGFKAGEASVSLSKIGKVRSVIHRPIEGKIKTCTVKKTPTGKWFVTFSCEVEKKTLPPLDNFVGIDAGVISFVTLSDGTHVKNPRFFKAEEKAPAKAQRSMSKHEKGTRDRRRKRKAVARVHERIANKRKDFAHKLSHQIVKDFGGIAVEDLNINNMQQDNFTCLNKSIADAAWNSFSNMLAYKAECAGRTFVRVNPAYTSQTCSRCGYRQKLKLSNRHYKCPCCELSLDRDENAALNILSLGLQAVGLKPMEAPWQKVTGE